MSVAVPGTATGTAAEQAEGALAEGVSPAGADPVAEKLARARAALGAAERSAARWGGRIDRTALRSTGGLGRTGETVPADGPAPAPGPVPSGALGGPTGLVPSPRPEAEPDGAAPRAQEALAPDDGHARLPLPEALAPLVPHGSLRAGSTVAVTGTASTSLLLALAATAAGQDAWCAIAGLPDLGLRAALDAGLDPCRLAIVPDAAEQTAPVLSALVDGVGVVVLGPHLRLAPALWRTLAQRARTRDALVIAAAPPGSADLQLETTALGWEGLGVGSGRLRRRRLAVAAAGRGIAGRRGVEVLLPEVRGMVGVLPEAARAAADTTAGIAAPAAAAGAAPLRAIRRAG